MGDGYFPSGYDVALHSQTTQAAGIQNRVIVLVQPDSSLHLVLFPDLPLCLSLRLARLFFLSPLKLSLFFFLDLL